MRDEMSMGEHSYAPLRMEKENVEALYRDQLTQIVDLNGMIHG